MYYLSTSIQWAFLPLFCFKEPKFPFQKNYVILYDSKRGGGCFSFWKELVCFKACLRTHSVYCKVRQEHFPLAPTSGLCSLLSCGGGSPWGPPPPPRPGCHGWELVYQGMICLGRKGGWSSKEKGQEPFPQWAFIGFNLHRNTGNAHQSLSGSKD